MPGLYDIFAAIARERNYQDEKYGFTPHEVGSWITILHRELREAEDAWCYEAGHTEALKEILQVIAVGVACLEQHGVEERDICLAMKAQEEDDG